MKTTPFRLMGKLKMLKPFKFKKPGSCWSDGFRQHGIFEIISKEASTTEDPICTVRRIGTMRPDCPWVNFAGCRSTP